MPSSPVRGTLLAVLALSAALAPVALAQQAQGVNGTRQTRIATPPAASGPSDNTTFSQDNRAVRMMAFDSAATNLVRGDSNQKRDVYVLRRGSGEGDLSGSLLRVSVAGRGGTQANGNSSKPSLDGDQKRRPHCVAFQSTARNLDRGDRSTDSDIYLRDISRKTTTLVSVGHRNATGGVVDGECEFVTYEASGAVFVRDLEGEKTTRIARGSNPDQQTNGKGVAYQRGGQIYQQSFQKLFNKGNPTVKKTARELLVSSGRSGRGNGTSSNPSADDNGYYVAFESTATNLCRSLCKGVSEDANGSTSDIYRKTISRKAPTKDTMQIVSFSFAVSEQGNGPSNNPAITGAGENVAFDSAATNLRQSSAIKNIDPNGPTRDIYYWNFPRARQTGNVSRESRPGKALEDGGVFNGASTNPSSSNRANFIAFTSAQSGRSGESNGASIEDVFIRYLGGGPEDTDPE